MCVARTTHIATHITTRYRGLYRKQVPVGLEAAPNVVRWRERSAAWPSARGDGSAVLFGAADASDVEVVVTQSTGPSLATIGRSLAKQHPLSPARSARSPESSHGNPRTQKPARR